MLFCVLDSRLFPCPRTHQLHAAKLAEGFVQHGYHYRVLHDPREIGWLSEADVLYVSNHFSTEPLHRQIRARLQARLMAHLSSTRASLVLWSFHTVPDWASLEKLPPRVVHLGEDLYQHAIAREPVLSEFRRRFGVLPLEYGSPIHPTLSTRVSIPKDFDFNFIGHGYQRELTEHCTRHYRSLIRNTPPNVSEPLRVNSFRRAQVNLVFHAPANIAKGIIVERFAEAMSMGGIIFHDHPRIAERFPSLASLRLVREPQDIDQNFSELMAMTEDEREALREASWQAWRASGLSYFDQARRVLAALQLKTNTCLRPS